MRTGSALVAIAARRERDQGREKIGRDKKVNSRERLFVGVLALAGGVLGGIISSSFTGRRAPATPATVTAKNFVLVDQTGKRRA